MKRNCELLILGTLLVWCNSVNATLDTIIIDQGQDDPVRIAVVPFKISGDLIDAVNLSDIITFDLVMSGEVDPVHR